jgi:heat shock protein HtpX
MVNIYEQITSNKRRSFLIIFLFVAFIAFAGYTIGYAVNSPGLLPIAIIFSFGSTGISYFWGDKIVLGLNKAHPASRKDYFDFYTVTENLAMADELPMPQIYVIDSEAMNAFATGRDPQHAIVCATSGLLAKLNRTELEGVIGHELSHVKNYDIRLMMIVSILIGTLSILVNLSSRSFFFGGGRRRNSEAGGILAIIGIIMIIFSPIIAKLIELAISRRREYFADASSVMLTRQPSGLISALQKLEADTVPEDFASTATASLYITNPFKGNKISSLFSTHPPIEDRIAALKKMI